MKYKKKQRKTAHVKFIGKEIKQLMKVRDWRLKSLRKSKKPEE
jgi:ribosomal protein L34E